jgi:hypothetical protein
MRDRRATALALASAAVLFCCALTQLAAAQTTSMPKLPKALGAPPNWRPKLTPDYDPRSKDW